MAIRKAALFVSDIKTGAGHPKQPPWCTVACSTVVKNSFAERDQDDLTCVVGASAAIGREITGMAVALLAPFTPVSCGNAALLEVAGEQERGVAMRTAVFGNCQARGSWWRQDLDFLVHEAGCPRRDPRHSARTQGRALYAFSLRGNDGEVARRPAARRVRRALCLRQRGRPNQRIGGLVAVKMKGATS
jgi:hypothetical protein